MELREVEVTFDETGDTPDGWAPGTRNYEADVTFTAGGKAWTETFTYHMGPGLTGAPEAADLLACLAMDASGGDQTFADFCDDYGYDQDSRKAYATWEAMRASDEKLQTVFGTHYGDFVSTDWESVNV